MYAEMIKISLLLSEIQGLKLGSPDGFKSAGVDELTGLYNGAGPDWLPQWGRKVLTGALELFEPAFLIHDYEFHHSDGKEKTFIKANKRMYKNMKKLVAASYSPCDPVTFFMYVYWRLKALAAYRSCARFGWSAWQDGVEANEQ
jgi:hypothetical protein